MTKTTLSGINLNLTIKISELNRCYEVESINARIKKKVTFNFSSFRATFYSGGQYHLRALITNIVVLYKAQKDRRRVNGTIDVS